MSYQNVHKRRSSDSNDENSEQAASSVKAYFVSKSQKPADLKENQVILNDENNNKLLIKIQESPKKHYIGFDKSDIMEHEINNSNLSFKDTDSKNSSFLVINIFIIIFMLNV